MTNENKINDIQLMFCPFGYLDLECCVNITNEISKDNGWIFEQIDNFSNEYGIKLENIDPVAVCLDSILQNARNELNELLRIDIDDEGFEANVHCNYLASSFQIENGGKKKILAKLKKAKIQLEDLNLETQYFLNNIE
tara:strand:+ start:3089 stop:3502 length:414 start_codon:yes stop_codon:yes gene_type:complete